MASEQELLQWIADDMGAGSLPDDAAPCKLLLIRLSLAVRQEDSMTDSIELAVDTFEKAALFRSLRDLDQKGYVTVFGEDNFRLDSFHLQKQNYEDVVQWGVLLTPKGLSELERIRQVQAASLHK